MKKTFNDLVDVYKIQLEKNDIQETYEKLIKYVLHLKTSFSKKIGGEFSTGNVSQGYMDYSYFPFLDTFLKDKGLRFGIVLNHKKARFELWLMGRNAELQKKYWDILKTTEWNKHRSIMPRYSVLEVILMDHPDFNKLDTLTQKIEDKAIKISNEIIDYLKTS